MAWVAVALITLLQQIAGIGEKVKVLEKWMIRMTYTYSE